MVDITHYLELGDPSHSSCLAEAALLPAPRIESYRGIQPISLDLGVAAAAALLAHQLAGHLHFFPSGIVVVTLAKNETCRSRV